MLIIQAVALDHVTGGFTVVLHCCGSAQTANSPPLPEEMQFTAYVTRFEIEQHAPMFDAAVSRIAQIFAADIMPHQCKNYEVKCATSYVDMDKAVLVSRGTSKATPLLISPALLTSSSYTFHGYYPSYLESFLLQPLYNTVAVLHVKAVARANTVDFRTKSLPSPSVIDKAIKRITEKNPQAPLVWAALSSAQAPQSTLPITAPKYKKGSMTQRTKEPSGHKGAGKDSQATVQMEDDIKAIREARRRRLKSPGPDALFGSPLQSKLFVSQSCSRDSTPSTVSSMSTIDYWNGEDESIFQGVDDPSSSSISVTNDSISSKPRAQYALVPPPTPSKLAPIINIGPKTQSAMTAAGLSDTVHTYLRNLVVTRVTTAWTSSLQGPPLSLSLESATAVSAAVRCEIDNMY
jgi:hypothetical protein